MTNGDKIRTLSNKQLAMTIMCPVDACIADEEDKITAIREQCERFRDFRKCTECCLAWLEEEH